MPIETVRGKKYDYGRLVQLYYYRRTEQNHWKPHWRPVKIYEGIARDFDKDGSLGFKCRYKNGKKNGHCFLVNDEYKYDKCYYKNDELHGKNVFKYLHYPGFGFGLHYYIEGKSIGKSRLWDNVGNIIRITHHKNNGSEEYRDAIRGAKGSEEYIRENGHISYKLNGVRYGMLYDWNDDNVNTYYCISTEDDVNNCYIIDNKSAWHHFTCFVRKIQKRIRKNSLKKLFNQLTYPRLDEFMLIMSYLTNDDVKSILESTSFSE